MAKYILEQAGDLNWMAIFALLTFFFLFLIGAFTILRRDSDYIEHMSQLPLDDTQSLTSETDGYHEK